MKIIEESKLDLNISKINNYKAKYNPINFYERLGALELPSLQNNAFKSDFAFFDELNYILNVILNIIDHPHLSNKGEEIVVRSDQAGHIGVDSFQRVLREPSFWKEKDFEFIPKEVYYYQYTDDVKIYENIFIGLVIKTISAICDSNLEFYGNLVPSITDADRILKQDDVTHGLNMLHTMLRKLLFIKNTYFYKEVSKVPLANKQIRPTNILIKDRLYNYCYRFYKKYITYFDPIEINNKFKDYCYFMLLKEFRNRGFVVKKNSDFDNYYLKYRKINVVLTKEVENINLKVFINNSKINTEHILYTVLDRFNGDNNITHKDNVFIDVITLWHVDNLSNPNEKFKNLVNEQTLIKYYLDSKVTIKSIKQELYSKYCPVCKSNNLEESNKVISCNKCLSKYTFINQNKAWFLRIGGRQ